MITKDQALHAINYLKEENNDGLYQAAINIIEQFISENTSPRDIKVVYAYKLRRADGKYMNKSVWDAKGKLYAKRANLLVALGSHISAVIEHAPDKPKAPSYKDHISGKISDQEYKEQYAEHMKLWRPWHEKARNDKEYRATFIPDDWVVVCIPVNTKADIIEISARDWYKGEKP